MELWKTDPDLYHKMEQETNKQRHSLPEAEVIETLMQDGYTFKELMELKRNLKGDSKFKCWN